MTGEPLPPGLQSLVQLCLREPIPYTRREMIAHVCWERTWGTLRDEAEFSAVVDEVIRRMNAPDLSYLAFKTETGETDYTKYREWALERLPKNLNH